MRERRLSALRLAAEIASALLVAVALLWLLLGVIPGVEPPDRSQAAARRLTNEPASGRESHAVSYEAALRRFAAMSSADTAGVNPACRSLLLTHGRRAEHAVVLFHGFTNCPMQFHRLAVELHARGMNVLVPRFPHHGLADRMTTDLSNLTAEDLLETAAGAIDLAHGLGERVSIMGLSATAVTAAWMAQHRADVDQAVLIAPSFAPKGMSETVARRFTGALLVLPNSFVWWSSKSREHLPGPRYCYPRFASRALGHVYRLGFAVARDARAEAPAAGRIDVVIAAADEGVNNELTWELVSRWREHGASVRAIEFPEWTGIRHDMIDPEQPYERTALSYPPLVALIETAGSEIDSARIAPARAWVR